MSLAELLEQAMKLPTPERAALAQELIESLHQPEDGCTQEEWEEAWGKELHARVERMDKGESVPRNCNVAMEEIRARRRKAQQ